LAGLQLTDAPPEESAIVFSFCEEVGLPTILADIGLGNIGRNRLLLVAEKACVPGASIHHEAGKITPEKVLHAMLAANAIGEHRKKRQIHNLVFSWFGGLLAGSHAFNASQM